MKANELMLLNLVKYGKRYAIVEKMTLSRVTILACFNGNNELIEETYDNIEPIPITREFLENNAWEREDMMWGADEEIEIWLSPDHRVELRSNKNHDMCNSDAAWAVHFDNVDFETIGSGEVTYLHELQNECNCKHYEFEWKL